MLGHRYEPGVQTLNLAPAGVEGMSPRVPEHRALNKSPGSLIAVLQPAPGGLHLAIWPSYRVSSDLPTPVQWRVSAPDFASEALGVQASQIVETNLGSEKPLSCLRGSQASLSIALGTKVRVWMPACTQRVLLSDFRVYLIPQPLDTITSSFHDFGRLLTSFPKMQYCASEIQPDLLESNCEVHQRACNPHLSPLGAALP